MGRKKGNREKENGQRSIGNGKFSIFHFPFFILFGLLSCSDNPENQEIVFGEIAPQYIEDGWLQLSAAATSGLAVTYRSSNESVAMIEGDRAVFVSVGYTDVTAEQAGNDRFYEAPSVTRRLQIHSNDPDKKTQSITFSLPTNWKTSQGALLLTGTASSGLPVSYLSGNESIGQIVGKVLILVHGDYAAYPLPVTAVQEGNGEYNAAGNVTRIIYVECDDNW
ncbi:MAG: hypothetical protein LBR08_03915 [Bacteroidales bacterium]|jgi:hypothetical protein|nr:hypothetical protein [Bacteroidales bacterium]